MKTLIKIMVFAFYTLLYLFILFVPMLIEPYYKARNFTDGYWLISFSVYSFALFMIGLVKITNYFEEPEE